MTLASGDTIAAVATASGNGAIGVVKISGPLSANIGSAITGQSGSDTALLERRARYLSFQNREGELIDQGVAIFFPAPNSYTGEDVFELQAHGNPLILDRLLACAIELGARLADPGEFTRRAFLNDRIDLTQAEAIGDLINSASTEAASAALRSMQGEFSTLVAEVLTLLTRTRVYVEAALDFAEEEIDFLSEPQLQGWLNDLNALLCNTLRRAGQGRVLREGLTIVLAGAPNVGKSSLLNYLTRQDSAIVTDVAGTTRDVLREHVVLDGIPLTLIDTAGLRDSEDPVEKEGIRRTRAQIDQADLILLVQCAGESKVELDQQLDATKIPVLRIYNKQDLLSSTESVGCPDDDNLLVSALTGYGMQDLRTRLLQIAGYEKTPEGALMARQRHVQALRRCAAHVAAAIDCLRELSAGELAAEELKLAQQQMQLLTGEFSSDDLLGEIFSSFCIGK